MDFPGGSDGKMSAYNVGDPGSVPGSGRYPGEGNEDIVVAHPLAIIEPLVSAVCHTSCQEGMARHT